MLPLATASTAALLLAFERFLLALFCLRRWSVGGKWGRKVTGRKGLVSRGKGCAGARSSHKSIRSD